MQDFDPFDGALLVDKPSGPTSHDVVAAVRRTFALKKVGHCGTLDPHATGLLILVLGRATRLSEKLMAEDKVYEGTFKLGESTTTYDAQGDLAASLPVPPLTLDQLNEETASFHGDQLQLPPMASAVKIQGVPLYKLARKGLEVDRKQRLIHIYTFRIKSYQEPIASFRVACTKGTYVRTLVHDLGQKLGCGAHLTALRRLSSGRFDVARALPLNTALQLPHAQLLTHIIPFLKLNLPTA
jgi:tRNA pseudouridine55 synthase